MGKGVLVWLFYFFLWPMLESITVSGNITYM